MSPHHSDHKRQKSLGLLRSFFFSKCVWVSYSVTQSLTGWPIDLSSDSEWTAKKAKSSPIWRKIHLADGVICWWIAGLCMKGDNTTFAFQPPLSFSLPVSNWRKRNQSMITVSFMGVSYWGTGSLSSNRPKCCWYQKLPCYMLYQWLRQL